MAKTYGGSLGRMEATSSMELDPRRWNDEQTALAVAVLVIAIASIAGTILDAGFLVRTFIAVFAGLIALVITSYYLTGSLIPPDEPPEDDSRGAD